LTKHSKKKSWDLAKEILLKIPKGSIDLTKNQDMNLFNIALENNQKKIGELIIEKKRK
jgi:hypothetical protein